MGATAPFVGLLGTVWGHLPCAHGAGWAGVTSLTASQGPVGEALVMTAAGLAVAIPAVLAYNVFGSFDWPHWADRPGRLLQRFAWAAGGHAFAQREGEGRGLRGPEGTSMSFAGWERTTALSP